MASKASLPLDDREVLLPGVLAGPVSLPVAHVVDERDAPRASRELADLGRKVAVAEEVGAAGLVDALALADRREGVLALDDIAKACVPDDLVRGGERHGPPRIAPRRVWRQSRGAQF